MLTGVRLEIEGDELRLAATDRYRLAVRELPWKPEQNELAAQVLIPARTLSESAKTLTTGSEITLALSAGGAGEGMIGFAGPARRATTRLLDAEFPKYRSLFPSEWSATADIPVPALLEAVKRVALVADRGTPVRLDFSDGRPAFYLLNVGETHYPYALPTEDPRDWPHISGVHGVFKHLDDAEAPDAPEFFDASALRELHARQSLAVEYLDSVFARLFDLLPSNTWVVVTSDHGELFGEDRFFGHGPIAHEKVFEVPFVEGMVP